jgi:hypothetical protein
MGIRMPAGMTVKIMENTDEIQNLILPAPRPKPVYQTRMSKGGGLQQFSTQAAP